jgi:type II secretory pathway pseudopilin PulG
MRRQGGFSYVIVMFVVAILSILSVRALENSLTRARRDKEAELLWVGQAYRDAIRRYYEGTPGSGKTYPPDLVSLLDDSRTTSRTRYLRKLYRDPVTDSGDWGLVLTDDGKVMGVYSLSQQQPLKTGGFDSDFVNFAGAKSYREWQFVYQPH